MNDRLGAEPLSALSVAGPQVDSVSLMLLAAVLAVVGVMLVRDHPKVLAVMWLASLAFVPVWMGINVKIYLAPASLTSIFVIICLFPTPVRRIGKADIAMVLMIVLCLATIALGGTTRGAVFDVLLQWLPALVAGWLITRRLGLNWMAKAIGIVFAIAGALAVIEFVTSYNFFVQLSRSNFLYRWANLQSRGGILRAEGAFGHSIALGASLAAALPLVLATNMAAKWKSVLVLLLLGGTIVSFSRVGMLCAVVGLVLTILFQRSGLSAKLRVLFSVVLAFVAFLALPYVSAVFDAAGTEATGSAAYRGNLISLIPEMAPLGTSPAAYRAPDGRLFMGNFRSIDSALILHGLTYGWLPLIVAVCLLLAAIALVLTRQAYSPTVSVVAQIPALATVALITQYASVFWIIVGMALCTQAGEGVDESGPRLPRGPRLRYGDAGDSPPRLAPLSSQDPVAEPTDLPAIHRSHVVAAGRVTEPLEEGSGA